MEFLEIKEELYLIRRISEELDFYKRGLRELLIHLDMRVEILEKFKGNSSDLYKFIRGGEILNDIVTNYTDYVSVSKTFENCSGEITDLVKVYVKKAEQQIIDTELFFGEIEDDYDIEECYVRNIREQLESYKSKNIFTELNTVEEILTSISKDQRSNYEGMNIFLNNISKYNSLDEIGKENNLNVFCYENIESNNFVDRLISLQNDYNGAEVIANIVEVEAIPLFSTWNSERLKSVLEYDSKIYFKIISTLNQIKQLNQDLLNVGNVNSQIKIIEEFLDDFS